jgi:outer membrane protein assembly factor BamB
MKKLFVRLAAAAAMGATVVCGTPVDATDAPSEWPQTEANAARSGTNVREDQINRWNVASLTVDRTIELAPVPPGAPDLDHCQLGVVPDPAVTATRMFSVDGEDLTSFDTSTGARRWVRPLPRPNDFRDAAHVIVAHGGRVFVGVTDCTSESDPNMRLVAFDAGSGKQLWSTTGPDFARTFAGWSTVVASEGRLVVLGANVEGQRLFVLDAATGTTRWSRSFANCLDHGPALVVRRSVIVSTCVEEPAGQALDALRLSDGTTVWSRPGRWTPERGDSASRYGRILLATDATGQLVAMDPATGKTRWARSVGGGNSLAVDATRVYARCGDVVCALSRIDGRRLWARAVQADKAAVANDVLYLGNGIALRAASGRVLDRLWSDGHRLVAVADGRVFALAASRQAFDLFGLPD